MYSNLISLYSANIDYFQSIYEIIILLKSDLSTIIFNNKNVNLDNIDILLINENIDNMKRYIDNMNSMNILRCYISFIELKKKLAFDINLIVSIDIINIKSLYSDNAKNNINDGIKKLSNMYNLNKLNEELIITESSSFLKDYDIIKIYQFVSENHNALDIFINLLTNYKDKDVKNTMMYNIKSSILSSNNKKIILLDSSTITNKVKHVSFPNCNFISNMNKYKYIYSDHSLNDLIYSLLSVRSTLEINNNFKSANLNKICELINIYYNTYKKKIFIIILESSSDFLSYSIKNLLNGKISKSTDVGISDSFLNATNTLSKSGDNNIIASNISNIHVLNTINLEMISKSDYNSDAILINSISNSQYDLYKGDMYNDLKLKDVINILINQPNHNIEKYNELMEYSILKKIDKINAMLTYNNNKKMQTIVKSDSNFLKLKQEIIKNAKKIKLEFNDENKGIILSELVSILSKAINNHIQNKNNIVLTSELYITCYSKINFLSSRFKKSLLDNYNPELVNNLNTILDKLESKIDVINELIIDKNPNFEFYESRKGMNLRATKDLAERERRLFEKRLNVNR